jgi:hypothetical protein
MRGVHAGAQEAGEQQAPQEPQAAPPSVFGRHAEHWFPAMLDAVLGAAPPDKGVHYLLLDCCVTWLEWPALFPRPPEESARRLVDHLVRARARPQHAPARGRQAWMRGPPPQQVQGAAKARRLSRQPGGPAWSTL